MKHKAKTYVDNFLKWATNKHKGVLVDKDKIIEELAKKLTLLKQESLENETIPRHFQDMLLENKKLSFQVATMEEDLIAYESALTKRDKELTLLTKKYKNLESQNLNLAALLEKFEHQELTIPDIHIS
jgi:hypothetical protein